MCVRERKGWRGKGGRGRDAGREEGGKGNGAKECWDELFLVMCRKKSFRRSRKVYCPQDPLLEERKVRVVVKWLHNHVMKSVFFSSFRVHEDTAVDGSNVSSGK